MSDGNPERRGIAPGTVFVVGTLAVASILACVGALTVSTWLLDWLTPELRDCNNG